MRAFGPDSATTQVLKDKGLPYTENIHRFLFALHHEKRKVSPGKEVWILDEAGKLGHRPLLEFLKEAEKKEVQVILSGDSSQLPSVERGGMFKLFCQRYSPQILVDIQRQKNQQQRNIAHLLARGNFGTAIHQLSDCRGIRWSQNKKEALEDLVSQWARDTQSFPSATTLIISHSNAEVRVLSEMVRIVRRQRGELGEKEFKCMTSQGSLFVSVGDRIEFRRNDSSLGVSNGLCGVLIEADLDRFVVSIQKDRKVHQTIVFNPKEYHAFQLGYASTYYRSQGRTVDRAYVLHSSMMNQQMFYVGLTRHVRHVSYFVSKEDAYCLADLKRLSRKTHQNPVAFEYTTPKQIEVQKQIAVRAHQIGKLKESDSIFEKIRGYGLATWDKITGKATDIKHQIQDRLPSEAFYRPFNTHLETSQGSIVDVSELKNFLEKDFSQNDLFKSSIVSYGNCLESSITEPLFSGFKNGGSGCLFGNLTRFTPEQQALIQEYSDKSGEATALKQVVEVEAESSMKDPRLASHFRAWQEACGLRNKRAHTLIQMFSSLEKNQIHPPSLIILQEQAARHELFLARQDHSLKQQSLEDQLKAHVEFLLYRLYPEGPTGRDRTHFRFRNKGSLSVACQGPKVGQFYDFEAEQGGGLLKLIQIELGLGKNEARSWAEDFLGNSPPVSIPKPFLKPFKETKQEDIWVSLKPESSHPAPSLEQLKGKSLDKYFNEVSRHAYKDENGRLLYHVLRLHDKNEPGKKITLPLSYGYWKSSPSHRTWELKGYCSQQKSLYNLHLLNQHPTAPVLIVEGEKTADLALSKFPGESYICVTWPGGAGAVSRADWTPLMGRKIVVWPDNDPIGYQAAEKVCQELRKVGVESLQLVNPLELKKHFPQKWDLADAMPTEISDHFPKKLLATALHKGINPEHALLRLSLNPKDPSQRMQVNEILWRVDERLRPSLEQKYGDHSWKIQDEILKETQHLFLSQNKQKIDLKEKYGLGSVVLEKLTYQVCLAQAQKGRNLRMNEIEILQETIQKWGYLHLPKTIGKEVTEIISNRVLFKACENALDGIHSKGALIKSSRNESLSFEIIEKQAAQVKSIQSVKPYDIAKEPGHGINL